MRKSLKCLLSATAAVLVAASAQAKKGTGILVPVMPFPGATTTFVFGVADDNNTVVGSYVDSGGLTHGFYGPMDGSNYTSFDFGSSGSTQARAIKGNAKSITGFSNIAGSHCDFEEWERDSNGNISQITKSGTPLNGIAQGLDEKGDFAGDYCDTGGSGTIFGMLGKQGAWQSDVTTPFTSSYTGERGVNNKGTIVGFYVDSGTGLQVGTIIQRGVTSQVIYPDPNQSYTVLEGINNSGQAAGQWGDTSGIVHSFAYDSKKATFTEIDDPAATSFTQAWGVNGAGLIAVDSDAGPYVYCPKKKNCPGGHASEIAVNVTHVPPGSMLHYGDAQKNQKKPAPARSRLPKGAALQ
jgi:hypothetical protein